ncbi:hypothetical protein [Candidatus Frankia nodulisporulans]|uniref:hypothetical protein n=1 Tax=Candidatus Frankia nodulisporulans TaxID=2060052 RepID=UPI0030B80A51
MTTPLTVALVTPLTGPNAAQGLAGLRGVTLWARDERLPAPWDEVSLTAYDAHPEPAAAMRAAAAAHPDALLGPYGNRAALAAYGADRPGGVQHGRAVHPVRPAGVPQRGQHRRGHLDLAARRPVAGARERPAGTQGGAARLG